MNNRSSREKNLTPLDRDNKHSHRRSALKKNRPNMKKYKNEHGHNTHTYLNAQAISMSCDYLSDDSLIYPFNIR